ncbi:transposase [Burkholderia cepacia]|uniref:transposase n=1 Tax=Burkholderia cepacia TaxID=292 RepID=UPI000B0DE12C
MPVADVIRQVGISEQTFYRWKKQYAGMQSDQVRERQRIFRASARHVGVPLPSKNRLQQAR